MQSASDNKRPWKEIAEEIAKEQDLDKVAELSGDLLEALDASEQPSSSSSVQQLDSHPSRKTIPKSPATDPSSKI